MIGAFIQLNTTSRRGNAYPLGYVICENGCWEWVGARYKGYGRYQKTGAHRFVYELLRGPIAPHLTIDHLCRNPACVNPDHMEPVTHRENTMRGVNQAAILAKMTHCKRGHPLTGDNVIRQRIMGRRCRACKILYDAQHPEHSRYRYRPWCAKCGKKYAHGCPTHLKT